MGQFLLYASHQPRNQSVHASFPVPSSQFVRRRSEWNPKAGSPSFRQETFWMRSGGYAQAICANIPEPAARSWSDISASGSYWSNEDARQSRNKECTWVKRGSLTHVLVKRIKLQQMHGVFPYVFSIFEKNDNITETTGCKEATSNFLFRTKDPQRAVPADAPWRDVGARVPRGEATTAWRFGVTWIGWKFFGTFC